MFLIYAGLAALFFAGPTALIQICAAVLILLITAAAFLRK